MGEHDIDFLSQDDEKKQAQKGKTNGSYIEYSSPDKKKKPGLFSFLKRNKKSKVKKDKSKLKKDVEEIRKPEKKFEIKKDLKNISSFGHDSDEYSRVKGLEKEFEVEHKEQDSKKNIPKKKNKNNKNKFFFSFGSGKKLEPLPEAEKQPVKKDNDIKFTAPGKDKEKKEDRSDFDVNLVPDDLMDELNPKKKILLIVYFTIIFCLIVALMYTAIYIYKRTIINRVTDLNIQIEEVNKEISKISTVKKEVEQINNAINDVDSILDTHVYWSQFFEFLEENTISDVYYTSFNGTISGNIVLNAIGRNFKNVSQQIEVFKQADEYVKDVQVDSAQKVQIGITRANAEELEDGEEEMEMHDAVSFNITLIVLPDIFYFKY